MRITILSLVCFVASYASGCTDIAGHWHNELGSRMVLNLDDGNRVTGKYWTAVEAKLGASAVTSNITGIFSKQNDGSLLAFSVLFNHGFSVAVWVGQCLVCGKQEVLYTTYILKKYSLDPKIKWASIVINQNTFWRSKEGNDAVVAVSPDLISSEPSELVDYKHASDLDIVGKWKSSLNGEIEIFTKTSNSSKAENLINGKWNTNRKEEVEVSGMSDSLEGSKGTKFATVALMSVSGNRIRSWAGHIPGSLDVHRYLETTWLEHEFQPNCMVPRTTVQFGMENFSKAISDDEYSLKKSETFFEKIRKFFASMF